MNTEEKILAVLEKHSEMFEQVFSRLDKMQATQTQMQTQLDRAQDDITSVKLYLELDVEKRFDAVNEGIDAILEKLTPKDRVEELEADVVVLKTAVKLLTQEVAELKKAQ